MQPANVQPTANLRTGPRAGETETIGVPRRPKLILALVCGACVLLLLSYLVGRWEAEGAAQRVEQRAAEQQRQHRANEQRLKGEVEGLQRRVQQLEARRAIHRAALALDEQNFGIARSELSRKRGLPSL